MIKELKDIDEVYLYLCWRISEKANPFGIVSFNLAEEHLSRIHHFPSKKSVKSLSKSILFTLEEKELIRIIPRNRQAGGDEIQLIVKPLEIKRLLSSYM